MFSDPIVLGKVELASVGCVLWDVDRESCLGVTGGRHSGCHLNTRVRFY